MGMVSPVRAARRVRQAGLWPWVLATLALLAMCTRTPMARADQKPLSRKGRLLIIRGLMREVAVSKIPLPRGKKGIYVDSQGRLDKEKAVSELRTNGAAIGPGMPIEITKIAFKSDEIVFEINGGGKSGKKWYQHLEIGGGPGMVPMGPDTGPVGPNSGPIGPDTGPMGPDTGPMGPDTGPMGPGMGPIVQQAPAMAYGSSITLTFPGKLPEITVAQVKHALGAVVDWERRSPTTLYSPAVPPKFKEAIKNHQVLVGMDRDSVLSAKGAPDRRVREVREGVEQEDWIYGLPPHVLFVTFDGDKVVAVKQY